MQKDKLDYHIVNPLEHLNKVLWCVYGHPFWLKIICCKLNDLYSASDPNIWGYSVWKRQPGFRTLGIKLSEFTGREDMAHFFTDQEHALAYIRERTTPAASAC